MATDGKHAKPKKAAEGPTQVLLVLECRSMLSVSSGNVELEKRLQILFPDPFYVSGLRLLVYLPLPESPWNLLHT